MRKKTDKEKNKKPKKKKSAEIVDFINKSKEKNKIQTEQAEIRKMDNLAKELNLDVKFFEHILTENQKYTKTVPNGMRL